jgi:putative glycosyltransferase (TIGR04372 family)
LFSELEYFLKDTALNSKKNEYKYVLPLDINKIPNKYFIKFISKHFLIPNKFLNFFYRQLSHSKLVGIDATVYFKPSNGHKKAYEISNLWGSRAPVFKHTVAENFEAKSLLNKLGVKDSQKYIVVNSRTNLGLYDDKIQGYRNCSLYNFHLAIQLFIDSNYDVVIAGNFDRSSLKKLPKSIINYIDSNLRSDMNDILLCSNATFFLGSSSGLFHIANSFHIPCGLSNMAPPSSTPLRGEDCFIPKLIFDKISGNILSLEDMYRYESNIFSKGEFSNSNYSIVENSPEDILILAEALISQDHSLLKSIPDLFPNNKKFTFNLAKMPMRFYKKYSKNNSCNQ